MSSTTETQGRARPDEGQALALFALSLVAVLGLCAMVFDVGQTLLDRRAQQNAADAAALAGSAYLSEPTCFGNPSRATCARAVSAAVAVAAENGFADGVDGDTVAVKIPPDGSTNFGGFAGHIQVSIGSRHDSFFQGLLGLASRQPGALAVAANNPGVTLPYSFIALNPTACGTNKVTGNGSVTVEGTVQVDSSCPANALTVSGTGSMTVPTCNVVGGFQVSGGGHAECEKPSGVTPIGDPLRELSAPPMPPAPAPVSVIAGGPEIPAGCPGSATPATVANPTGCTFSKAGTYRIFPGLYPGGLKFNRGKVYMEPGIYYLAGGGFTKSGTGSQPPTILTVDPGGSTFGGGVLLYSTCASAPASGCAGSFDVHGGSGSTIELRAIETTIYRGILIFLDRAATTAGPAVVLNGAGNDVHIEGNVYVPSGEVQVNGGGSGMTVQVIADTFKVNGNGNLQVGYDEDIFVKFKGVGLVQ